MHAWQVLDAAPESSILDVGAASPVRLASAARVGSVQGVAAHANLSTYLGLTNIKIVDLSSPKKRKSDGEVQRQGIGDLVKPEHGQEGQDFDQALQSKRTVVLGNETVCCACTSPDNKREAENSSAYLEHHRYAEEGNSAKSRREKDPIVSRQVRSINQRPRLN